jgi:cytochrome P450
VSDLIGAEIEGEALTDAEIVSFLFFVLPAGFQSVVDQLSTMMLGFVSRPDDFTGLRADPAKIPTFVEEALRHDPGVHGAMRVTTQDVEIGGVKLPRGTLVLALLGSANRDAAAFPDPDRFDPARASQGGSAFGHGVHYCLGAPLARLELRIVIEELAKRFRGFELLPGELTWNVAVHIRGPNALPLRFLRA